MRILYLTANAQFAEPPVEKADAPDLSKEYPRLDLWPELEGVTKVLFDARCDGRVELEVVPEAKRSDIPRHLGERSIDVLHFSGHGDKDRPLDERPDGETEHRLILMDEGHEGLFGKYVENDWLREQLQGKEIKLLVLNCCWSEGVAEKLKGVADCIIGTKIALREDRAAEFSEILYSSLEKGATLGEIKKMLSENKRFSNLYEFKPANDDVLNNSLAPVPLAEREMTPARLILAKRDEFLALRSSIKSRAVVEGLKIGIAIAVAVIGWLVLTNFNEAFPGQKDWMAYEPAAIMTALAGHPISRLVGFLTVAIGAGTVSRMLLTLSLRSPAAIERELASDRINQTLEWLRSCFDLKLPAPTPAEDKKDG